MKITYIDNSAVITDVDSFNIQEILECGQCFRFVKLDTDKYQIIALNRTIEVKQSDNCITIYPCNKEDFETLWYRYFDFATDYNKIKSEISENDEIMSKAVSYAGGIRLLNQEPFETLLSFIISQNNNIPRIKGIINRLSENYGTKQDSINESYFPTLSQLLTVTENDYRAIGTGFRAKYLADCVEKLSKEEIDLNYLMQADAETAKKELLKIKGVGPKVADCVLLFSLGKRDMFPVDVWVKRVMETLYFDGKETSIQQINKFATEKWGKYAGYAQQYLFYYARSEKIGQ